MAVDLTPYEHRTELSLASSGAVLDVWDEYAISLSMLEPGSPWTFTFWRSDAVDTGLVGNCSTPWEVITRGVKVFDRVLVTIDGAVQLNGRIETRAIRADRGGGAVVVVNGRDLAGPAMDWDVDPTITIKNTALSTAVERCFAQLGIPAHTVDSAANVAVTAREAPGPRRTNRRARRAQPVDIAHPRPGDRVWPFVEGIVKRIGYRMWVAPSADGELAVVVDVPNDTAAPLYSLRLRDGDERNNLLRARVVEDAKERYTQTEVVGDPVGWDGPVDATSPNSQRKRGNPGVHGGLHCKGLGSRAESRVPSARVGLQPPMQRSPVHGQLLRDIDGYDGGSAMIARPITSICCSPPDR